MHDARPLKLRDCFTKAGVEERSATPAAQQKIKHVALIVEHAAIKFAFVLDSVHLRRNVFCAQKISVIHVFVRKKPR
jgi:hypothetical protein